MIARPLARAGLASASAFLIGFGAIVWFGTAAIGEVKTPRAELLRELNRARAGHERAALEPDPRLARAARLRARDLAPRLRPERSEPLPGPPLATIHSRLASLERPAPEAVELYWLGAPDEPLGTRAAVSDWLEHPDWSEVVLDPARTHFGAVVFDTRSGHRLFYAVLAGAPAPPANDAPRSR